MNITFDPEADAVCIALTEKGVAESEEVKPGVVPDYDVEGLVVGVELLYLSKRSGTPGEEVLRQGRRTAAPRSSAG